MARDGLWRALTPQMFRYGLLLRALRALHRARRGPSRTRRRRSNAWDCSPGWSAAAPTTSRSRTRRTPRSRRRSCGRQHDGDEGWSHEGGNRLRRACLRAGRSRDAGRRDAFRRPRRRSRIRMATCCCTRCAMRCSAPWRWATSASIFPTAIRAGRAPTAGSSCGIARALLQEHGWRLVNADLTLLARGATDRAVPAAMRATSPTTSAARIDASTSRPRTSEGLGAPRTRRGPGRPGHRAACVGDDDARTDTTDVERS